MNLPHSPQDIAAGGIAADDGQDTYGARPIRRRRSKAQIEALRQAIHQLLARDNPMTVRQVFYQLVSLGIIAKTEREYKSTVIRLLANMRRRGEIPFGWVADNTRWMRKPTTYSNLEEALRRTAKLYRRAVWDDQDAYVEIWLEKEALAGVLYEVTERWDVPLMVTRGYPSISYLYEAAEAIEAKETTTYLYYFGDYDPSGLDITRAVEEGIREFAPHADIRFTRVAVTPEQIADWDLPMRPTKPSDSRSRSFEGQSVEIDAIPVIRLRRLADRCVVQHVDERAFAALQVAEEGERELLERMVAETGGGRR